MIQLQQAPSASPTRPSLTTLPRQSYTHIKDIDSVDTGIQRYRIFARAVDFYPLKLEDAFYQFCQRCNIEWVNLVILSTDLIKFSTGHRIPKSKQACFGCSDFEHEYIQYLYQMYVMIEDEDGKQIMVSINDEVSWFLLELSRELTFHSVHCSRDWNVYICPTTRQLCAASEND